MPGGLPITWLNGQLDVTESIRTITRRETIAWVVRAGLIAGLAPTLGVSSAFGQAHTPGYGTDPNLLRPTRPWPLTLSRTQLASLDMLSDVLLPADGYGPAPSAVGIAAFFDEWLSAPYPEQSAQRIVLLPWLEQFEVQLSDTAAEREIARWLTDSQQSASKAFTIYKSLCLIGYYTTDQGMADLGYVIPTPSASFPGPPREVLEKLGLLGD